MILDSDISFNKSRKKILKKWDYNKKNDKGFIKKLPFASKIVKFWAILYSIVFFFSNNRVIHNYLAIIINFIAIIYFAFILRNISNLDIKKIKEKHLFNILFTLFIPVVLSLFVYISYKIVSVKTILIHAIFITYIIIGGVYFYLRNILIHFSKSSLVLCFSSIIPFLFVYILGFLLNINCIFYNPEFNEVYISEITSIYTSNKKSRKGWVCYADTAKWHNEIKKVNFVVPWTDIDSTNIGDPVKIVVCNGLFGVKWVEFYLLD